MFTMENASSRRTFSAVAAVAVVAFAGLALEYGHQGAVRQGVVEIGELEMVNVMQMVATTLPEIVVTGQRDATAQLAAQLPQLPEVVVTAERPAAAERRVARQSGSLLPALAAAVGQALVDGGRDATQPASSASVLLK